MSPNQVFSVIVIYFGILLLVSYLTSRKSDTQSFLKANNQSRWYLVAFGMVGASLSGVTFLSVPGLVYQNQFAYFQMVLGYLLGYLVIGTVLLPLYYHLNLTSIYTYLSRRLGFWSYKTGAFFFLLSRTIGAAFRLFLAATALQLGLFDKWGIPFWMTTIISILLIWVYTNRAGIKTIVWTDTLQTTFMLLAAVISVYLIKEDLQLSFTELSTAVFESGYSRIWFWDSILSKNYFIKQFVSGMFIAIVMTGLDQDMMQKNLTCRNLKEAQKNMFWFSVVLVIVNFIFLTLGALLYVYAFSKNIDFTEITQGGTLRTDKVYAFLAFNHFSTFTGIIFLLGVIAATYSSADSALTSLTTSFCIDFLEIENKQEKEKKQLIREVHIIFSVVLVIFILLFKVISDSYPGSNVIGNLFTAATYTYGPLLGLYAFGLFTEHTVKDHLVPVVCIVAPLLTFFLHTYSKVLLGGYEFAYEHLIINGLLTFSGLLLIKKSS